MEVSQLIKSGTNWLFALSFFAFVLLVGGAGASTFDKNTTSPILTSGGTAETYLVTNVIDGDTIEVSDSQRQYKVRLIGIDTPETRHPNQKVECFGREASARVKELIQDVQVQLELDETQGGTDRYGRLLAYVILPNGTNLGYQLINEGYATEYTYGQAYKYQKDFVQAQEAARAAGRGLWGAACNAAPQANNPTAVAITPPPANTSRAFECNCNLTCSQISSCDEAYYQLNSCGCNRLDGNNDGIPCTNLCTN
jgi:endonuclease YncB( thermonuclease family)